MNSVRRNVLKALYSYQVEYRRAKVGGFTNRMCLHIADRAYILKLQEERSR